MNVLLELLNYLLSATPQRYVSGMRVRSALNVESEHCHFCKIYLKKKYIYILIRCQQIIVQLCQQGYFISTFRIYIRHIASKFPFCWNWFLEITATVKFFIFVNSRAARDCLLYMPSRSATKSNSQYTDWKKKVEGRYEKKNQSQVRSMLVWCARNKRNTSKTQIVKRAFAY